MGRRIILTFTCPKCDRQWNAPVDVEYGIPNLVRNEDLCCPECGMETDWVDLFDERLELEERSYELWKELRIA